MRVSREKAAQNRDSIVDAAARLFRERGFDGVGVDAIMEDAGLTHGGFYGHFASKGDLICEACTRALDASADRWADLVRTAPPGRAAEAVADHYLSHRHRDDPGAGCVFATLAADVARSRSKKLHRSFTAHLERMADTLAGVLKGGPKARRRAALARVATMVGAVVLARAADDAALSDEILAAARIAVTEPG